MASTKISANAIAGAARAVVAQTRERRRPASARTPDRTTKPTIHATSPISARTIAAHEGRERRQRHHADDGDVEHGAGCAERIRERPARGGSLRGRDDAVLALALQLVARRCRRIARGVRPDAHAPQGSARVVRARCRRDSPTSSACWPARSRPCRRRTPRAARCTSRACAGSAPLAGSAAFAAEGPAASVLRRQVGLRRPAGPKRASEPGGVGARRGGSAGSALRRRLRPAGGGAAGVAAGLATGPWPAAGRLPAARGSSARRRRAPSRTSERGAVLGRTARRGRMLRAPCAARRQARARRPPAVRPSGRFGCGSALPARFGAGRPRRPWPCRRRLLTNLPSSTGGIFTDTSSPSGLGSFSSSIGTNTAAASASTTAPTRRRRAARFSSSTLHREVRACVRAGSAVPVGARGRAAGHGSTRRRPRR